MHPDTAAFVYVAARYSPEPRIPAQVNHRNVIVLDNDAMMHLYGPTLGGSYQFLLRAGSDALISCIAAYASDSAGSSSAASDDSS